jgi:hypothetical protein
MEWVFEHVLRFREIQRIIDGERRVEEREEE